MEKRVLAYSPKMKGELDDDYTLYDDIEIAPSAIDSWVAQLGKLL